MTEFSTRSMLEVVVDDRSLSDARDTIESELGSVRATVTSDRSGRGATGGTAALSDGGGGVRAVLETQTEHLDEIREALEDIRNDGAAGGGGGGSGGLPVGAGALGALGSVGVAKAALAAGGIGLGAATDQTAREQLPDGIRSTLQQSQNFRETPIGTQLVNPVEFAQTAGEVFAAEVRSRLAAISISQPDWIGRLTGLDLSAPEWLSRLTSVRFRRDQRRTQVRNDITVEAIIDDLGNAQRIIEQSVTQRLRDEVID